jgi:hypothetical protein
MLSKNGDFTTHIQAGIATTAEVIGTTLKLLSIIAMGHSVPVVSATAE